MEVLHRAREYRFTRQLIASGYNEVGDETNDPILDTVLYLLDKGEVDTYLLFNSLSPFHLNWIVKHSADCKDRLDALVDYLICAYKRCDITLGDFFSFMNIFDPTDHAYDDVEHLLYTVERPFILGIFDSTNCCEIWYKVNNPEYLHAKAAELGTCKLFHRCVSTLALIHILDAALDISLERFSFIATSYMESLMYQMSASHNTYQDLCLFLVKYIDTSHFYDGTDITKLHRVVLTFASNFDVDLVEICSSVTSDHLKNIFNNDV